MKLPEVELLSFHVLKNERSSTNEEITNRSVLPFIRQVTAANTASLKNFSPVSYSKTSAGAVELLAMISKRAFFVFFE